MNVTAQDAKLDESLREFMSPMLGEQRFFLVTVDDDPKWFALCDRLQPDTRCDSGFRCIATFDRKIDVLVECCKRNDEEEKDVL